MRRIGYAAAGAALVIIGALGGFLVASRNRSDAATKAVNDVQVAVNAHIDMVLNQKVGAGGLGFNTEWFCVEGSIRSDSLGAFQEYLTVFSRSAQTIMISYITNKGTFQHPQPLSQRVRYTEDAVAYLVGSSGPLAGQKDVDVSIEVKAPQPVFVACPLYFDRRLGQVGPVSGGTVQEGTHN
jgi:hypothetical protein